LPSLSCSSHQSQDAGYAPGVCRVGVTTQNLAHYGKSIDRTKEWVQHQIILNRLDAVDANAASIDEKLYWVRWTQRLLAVEVIYLVGLVIVRPYIG